MAKAFLKSINMPHVNIPFSKLDWNGFTIMSICAWHMECFFPRNQNHECYIILCLPIKSINLQYITKNSVGNRKKWNRPIISRVILFLNLLNWYDFGMLQFTCTDTIDYFFHFLIFFIFYFLETLYTTNRLAPDYLITSVPLTIFLIEKGKVSIHNKTCSFDLLIVK